MTEPKKHRIMLVDDSPFIHKALSKALEPAGYEICGVFRNGQLAVENYSILLPDLLIMDITMPVMDGVEAAREISARHPGAKIMMLSAMGDEEILEEARAAGASGFMTKPFSNPELLEAVEKQLSAS
ncbi:response regulator [Heliobacterium gestii]|uniref:Stage 0 sporulation protein A homolog n=1 Tax=Heliomicrobium gestii TaxID=2699 RepID=A0A845LBP4_HELGE|nr:response regulator [Heliomicrobium gestii]MBM7865838.1 two-component system chemotaxis response regulator CheY [Heliomicrobium gestii]MZP42079.1 response regulator [Heliomicrobium gestii]